MKRKGMSPSAQVLLVVAALVAGGLVAQQAGFLSTTQGPSQGDDDSVASLYLKANDDLASDQPAEINVSYEVVGPDGEEITGTTDTTQGYAQINNLDENTDYTVRMYDDDGSGEDFYFEETTITTGEGVKRQTVDLMKEGSATTQVSETVGTEDDNTLPISQGATDTFDVEVKENTQNAVFRQPALVVKTNSTDAISDLEVSGSTAESVPDRLSSYDDLYDTGTAEIVDFNKETYTVQVTRAEDSSAEATVDVAVVDLAHFKNDQGEWTTGYEDSNENDVGAGDATITTQTVTTP